MATFVCIHGAFQGGWVWKKTAKALRDRGHEVHTPTLSGCGHHRHALDRALGLGTFIRDVVSYVELEDLSRVVLVAHSYSGLVCAGAMPKLLPRLAGAIFVDAIIPEPGRSFAGLAGEPFRRLLESRLLDDWLVSPWPAAMFGVEDVPDGPWFMARTAPFPRAAFTDAFPGEPLGLPEKRHFVRCTGNPNPLLAAMAARAQDLGFAMHAIDCGHCPQIAAPETLARTLSDIAVAMGGVS